MLKKAVMLFLALILMVSASAGFAAEKMNGKTGKAESGSACSQRMDMR